MNLTDWPAPSLIAATWVATAIMVAALACVLWLANAAWREADARREREAGWRNVRLVRGDE